MSQMLVKLLVLQALCCLAHGLILQSAERKGQVTSMESQEKAVEAKLTQQTTQKSLSVREFLIKDSPSVLLEPFFIYDDPYLNSTLQLAGCKKETSSFDHLAVTQNFLRQMEKDPSRVSNPLEAKWYIVPWDIDETYLYSDGCKGLTSRQWMEKALDRLEDSQYFKSHEGRDHIWIAMHPNLINPTEKSLIPANRAKVLKNMVIGRYVSYHQQSGENTYDIDPLPYHFSKMQRSTEDWRCTMLLPASPAPKLFIENESYGTWKQRQYSIFFRGNEPNRCKIGDAVRNATKSLHKVVPGSIIEDRHALFTEQYVSEITSSKFCLIESCDDVQTSRLVDAMAAGCIPIVIADGWGMVAKPFSDHINYDTFVIRIPEALWLTDAVGSAHWIYNWPDVKLRRMHAAMYEARNALLWNHPQSMVGPMAMQQVNDECTPLPEGDALMAADEADWTSNSKGQ